MRLISVDRLIRDSLSDLYPNKIKELPHEVVVTNWDDGTISILQVTDDFNCQPVCPPIPIGTTPYRFAFSSSPLSIENRRFIYVVSPNNTSLFVVDRLSKSVVREVPLSGCGFDIAVVDNGKKAYIAVPSYAVDVVDLRTYRVIKTIPVTNMPGRIAISRLGDRAYVFSQFYDHYQFPIYIINTSTDDVLHAGILINNMGDNPVFSPDGRFFYVPARGIIYKINTINNIIEASCDPGGDVYNLAITADGSRLYAGAYSSTSPSFVAVIDTFSFQAVQKIDLGTDAVPEKIILTHDEKKAYILDTTYGKIHVIDCKTYTTRTISIPDNRDMAISYNQRSFVSPRLFREYIAVTASDQNGSNVLHIVDTLSDKIKCKVVLGKGAGYVKIS